MLIPTAASAQGRGHVQRAINLLVGCRSLSRRARGYLAPNKALPFLICVLLSPSCALLHLSTQTLHHLALLNAQQGWKDEALASASLLTTNQRNFPQGMAASSPSQSVEAWTKDPKDCPNNHWILSFMMTPWTILWLTCTVTQKHNYKTSYLTTACTALQCAVWWCPEVLLNIMALSCDSLCISIVKQSPCPEKICLWRDKSVMIKHDKSNRHPASCVCLFPSFSTSPQRTVLIVPFHFHVAFPGLFHSKYTQWYLHNDLLHLVLCPPYNIDNNVGLVLFLTHLHSRLHQKVFSSAEPELEKVSCLFFSFLFFLRKRGKKFKSWFFNLFSSCYSGACL